MQFAAEPFTVGLELSIHSRCDLEPRVARTTLHSG